MVGEPWSGAALADLGIPEVLHLDNAREFHSEALRRGGESTSCSSIDRSRRPTMVATSSGLIGTMMGKVHLLPGTTFSDIRAKGDLDPEKTAAMTLDELQRWLPWIAGEYHNSLHGAIKMPPLAAWERGIVGDVATRSRRARCGLRSASFFTDFLPLEWRLIRRGNLAALDPLLVPVLTTWFGEPAQDDCSLRSAGFEPHLSARARWSVLRFELPGCSPPADQSLGASSGA